MRLVHAALVSLVFPLVPRCHGPRGASAPERMTSAPLVSAAAQSASPPPEMPHVSEAPVPGDLPVFVIRGVRQHHLSVVFVTGMCTHPGGYLAAFPWTAVEHGDVIGLQGDVPCGDGTYRRWGGDLDRLERRIDDGYRAAGLDVPDEIVLIGYSQGAERAERLAARRPERYKKLVLISSPITSSPARLGHARAVVVGIGAYEGRASTMASVAALDRAGVTTAWFVLPGAHHGQLGPDAQDVMGDVLTWLENPVESRAPATIRTPLGHTVPSRASDAR